MARTKTTKPENKKKNNKKEKVVEEKTSIPAKATKTKKAESASEPKKHPPAKSEEPTPPSPRNYLNNRDLVEEVKKSKKQSQMTDKLAKMLMMLCSRYAKKGNFVGYSYNDDMQSYAIMMLVRTWNAYDPDKSNNAFAFYTQCIKHSFIQFLNQEKRQRTIKDVMLVDQGMNPSHGFVFDQENTNTIEDEEDHESDYIQTDQSPEDVNLTADDIIPSNSVEKPENKEDNQFMKF